MVGDAVRWGVERDLIAKSGVSLHRSTERFYLDALADGEAGLRAVRAFRLPARKHTRVRGEDGELDLVAKRRVPQEVVVVVTSQRLFVLEKDLSRAIPLRTIQWIHSDVDPESGQHVVRVWDLESPAEVDSHWDMPSDAVWLGLAHSEYEVVNSAIETARDTPSHP